MIESFDAPRPVEQGRPPKDRSATPGALAAEQLCLVVEPPADEFTMETGLGDPPRTPALAVPPRPSWLPLDGGDAPRIHADPPAGPAFHLEWVKDTAGRACLFVRAPHARAFRTRGGSAPGLAALVEGDHFRLANGFCFHVAIHRRPRLGAPAPEMVGQSCPVCLSQIESDFPRVLVCACGTVYHCAEAPDGNKGLQCAQAIGVCAVCQRPLTLTAGFAWKPAFCRELPIQII